MPLYNKLKEYRAKLGVNQQEMGALVQTSRQTISQIERGDYSPSVTLALKIAKVCGVCVEDIYNICGHDPGKSAGRFPGGKACRGEQGHIGWDQLGSYMVDNS